MLEPMYAIRPDIAASLGTTPLYKQWSWVNKNAPAPPYAVLAPVIRPANPNDFDKALDIGLDIIAPIHRIDALMNSVGWLDDHVIATHGELQYIKYSLRSGPVFREPDVFMPDGTTEVWHYSGLYRATYTLVSAGGVS